MTEPTDAEAWEMWLAQPLTGHAPKSVGSFARAVLAKWGQPPAGAGEVAEHYRNAIASACEGWTMPDGLRKHLEAALWNPPTPQPTHAQAGAVPLTDEQIKAIQKTIWHPAWCDESEMRFARAIEAAHGIGAKQ